MALHWREDTINPNPFDPPTPVDPEAYQKLLEAYEALQEEYDHQAEESLSQYQALCGDGAIVEMPEGITKVRGYLFNHNTAVQGIKIPASATINGAYLFEGAINLVYADIKGTMALNVSNIFNGCNNLKALRLGPCPSNVRIGQYAFRNCPLLELLEIPEGVVKVTGAWSIAGLNSLKALVLPSTWTDYKDNLSQIAAPADFEIYCDFPRSQSDMGDGDNVHYEYKNLPADDPAIIKLERLRAERDAIIDSSNAATLNTMMKQNVANLKKMAADGLFDDADEELTASLASLEVVKKPALDKVDIQPVGDIKAEL